MKFGQTVFGDGLKVGTDAVQDAVKKGALLVRQAATGQIYGLGDLSHTKRAAALPVSVRRSRAR